MQITVSGKQVDLSDALRVRVTNQLTTITGKYFGHAQEAHVTFGRARSFFTCDINIHAGRGLTLRGEGEAADANAALDDAAEHIAKRLRRYRRRVNEHHRDESERERPQAARQYVLRQEDEDAAPENAALQEQAPFSTASLGNEMRNSSPTSAFAPSITPLATSLCAARPVTITTGMLFKSAC